MALAKCAHQAGETSLSCGRCGSGICGKCAVNSIVGTRCRTCAPVLEKSRGGGGGGQEALFGFAVGIQGRVVALVGALGLAIAAALYAWNSGDRDQLVIRTIVYGGWLFTLSLHEFSHSFVAYIGGDKGIRQRGFLTLNPMKFMDPVYSVVVPMVFTMLGGLPLIGGRTLIDHRALRGRAWQMAVSFAGPAMNLVVAGVIGLAFQFGLVDPFTALGAGLAFLAVLQIAGALFNLIPFPPLDGFNFFAPYLPDEVLRFCHSLGRGGYFLLIGVFWFVPGAGEWFWAQVWELTYQLDLPLWSALWGGEEARLVDRGWW